VTARPNSKWTQERKADHYSRKYNGSRGRRMIRSKELHGPLLAKMKKNKKIK
jgi:hypothetical protein